MSFDDRKSEHHEMISHVNSLKWTDTSELFEMNLIQMRHAMRTTLRVTSTVFGFCNFEGTVIVIYELLGNPRW